MKKLLLVTIAVLFTFSGFSQVLLGKYYNSTAKKNLDVEANFTRNHKNFYITITVNSANVDSSESQILVSSYILKDFKESFMDIANKYSNWIKIAQDNNITDLSKEMEIKTPRVGVQWGIRNQYSDYDVSLTPIFVVNKEGKCELSIIKYVYSNDKLSSNYLFLTFNSPDDIKHLISLMDNKIIQNKLAKREQELKLFK